MHFADDLTKEELEEKISKEIDFQKLATLSEHITDSIREILNSCGLYFRIFSRVKSVESIASKLIHGNYGMGENDKKVQDLLGIRVVLYYYDDLSICRDIMEDTFQMVDSWSRTNFNPNEFRATKINGVFRYPAEYFHIYPHKVWALPVDETFEIQFRTVFFEGWHEIEHDMRYKSLLPDDKFWMGSEELARVLNCVLANLELSDWTIVQLFEELAYNHYKHGNWELMLKSRFRIKMDESEGLHPGILNIFNQNRSIAKLFFKCTRQDLIYALLRLDNPHINYNLIVRLLNDEIVKNDEVAAVCSKIEMPQGEKNYQRTLPAPLDTSILFHLELPLLHKETRMLETEFANASSILYRWCRFRFHPVFSDMPAQAESYQSELAGYRLHVDYNPEKMQFMMDIHYIDSKLVGTLWHLKASICLGGDRKLHFCHTTSRDMPQDAPGHATFIRPSYLADLSSKIGIVDVVRLGSKAQIVSTREELTAAQELICNPERTLPLILIAQRAEHSSPSSGISSDVFDMNTYTINGTRIAKVIGLYSHVYMIKYELLNDLAPLQDIPSEQQDGCICIFWPASARREKDLFTREMVLNARFDFNRLAFHTTNISEKAFRHQLVQIIKDNNISL